MALITHTIPNLTNGVSQQPKTVRLDNQCEEQINASCRITDGLGKRNSLVFDRAYNWNSSPTTLLDANLRIHHVKYTDPLGYKLTKYITVDGDSGRIDTYYGGFTNSYLLGATKQDIKFLSNDKDTYILNKKKVCSVQRQEIFPYVLYQKDEAIWHRHQGSLVVVKNGYFGTTYGVNISLVDLSGTIVASVGATHVTPASSSAAVDVLQTSSIANSLKLSLQTAIIGNATMSGKIDPNIYRANNCLQVKFSNLAFGDTQATSYKIVVTAESTTASEAIVAMNGETNDILNLPKNTPVFIYDSIEKGRTGYTMRVGTFGEEETAYYLRYSETLRGWYETTQPSSYNDVLINAPLKLTLNPTTGSFTLSQINIAGRKAGDSVSNPDPSFINESINDMFVFGNRLGFISTNTIVLSKIDDFESFYKTTTASTLASDRVDISVDVTEGSNSKLNFAVPFESSIMLFGERAQFLLQTTAGFDITKTSLKTSTEYSTSTLCPPINLGSTLYFPVTRSLYSGLYDMSRKDGTGITAEEATHHIPTYIKGNVIEMGYSSTENMLFVRTDAEPRTIYVQNRYVRQTVLEQNAWHKWTVSNDIISIIAAGSELWVTMLAPNGNTMIVNKMDLSIDKNVPSASPTIDFTPTLDNRRFFAAGSGPINTDSFFPYYVPYLQAFDLLIAVDNKGTIYEGLTAINVALATEDLWVGYPVNFYYKFSEQVPASNDGERRTVYQYGRLTLRSMRISYSSTGKFEIKVVPTARPAYTTYFTGITLGTLEALMGKVPITTGVFKFPVNGRSSEVIITIESNNPYPCSFSTCEWQGTFTNNSGRM
jgi:hypothetical protein